jgi:hypothetical protein
MQRRDWAQVVRRRNLRELAAAAVVAGLVLWRDGFGLRTAPLLLAVAFVSLVLLTVGRWRAADGSEHALRRELVRQGRLLQFAWLWYVGPLFVGGALYALSLKFTAVYAVGALALSAVNFVAGTKLVREGR